MIAWYGHPGWDGWGPGGWIWIAAMVLFWAGLLAATVYLIRRRPAPAATGGAGPAETALAELYARGEIDADEYRRRQAVLREQHALGPGCCRAAPRRRQCHSDLARCTRQFSASPGQYRDLLEAAMAAPVSGSAPGSVAVAPPRGSPGLAEPGHDSGAAREAAFEVAAAPPWAENPSLRPRTGSPELNADLVPGGRREQSEWPGCGDAQNRPSRPGRDRTGYWRACSCSVCCQATRTLAP
jgi:putative membrane protein